MSKLALENKVPQQYIAAPFVEIIRAICQQSNSHSEGKLAGRYQAQDTLQSSIAGAVGDIIWDSNTTVRGSVAPGVAASYVRLGWVCTAGSLTDAKFEEMRVLTGA